MKTKIKMYWKEDGTKVRSHTRGLNRRKNAPRTIVGSNRGTIKALLFFGMLIVISGIFSWQAKFNEMDAQKVKAENTCPADLPLNGATSFESADMPRDTIDRDRVESVEEIINRIFKDKAEEATKIFTCESNLRADAVGDTNTKYHSIGVAQIRMLPERNLDREWLKNPLNNITYAKILYDKSGWKPWSCRGVIK